MDVFREEMICFLPDGADCIKDTIGDEDPADIVNADGASNITL